MPIEFFYCPDGGTIGVGECLTKAGCRMVNEGLSSDRCVPRDILQEAVKERRYDDEIGVSVTSLEKDALFHWLKEKYAYGVDPTKGASRYIGTSAHYFREHRVAPGDMPEVKLYFDIAHGTSDMVSVNEWTGGLVLSDLKTRSIHALTKMLGVEKVRQPDPSGAVYKRSGKWGQAGTPKMIDVRGQCCNNCGAFHPGVNTRCPNCNAVMYGDLRSEINQVNYYRIGWEQMGHKIESMEIVVILRDYGAQAKQMGFDREIYRIPVPFVDNEILIQDAAIKQAEIGEAMKSDEMPPMCSDEARWNGRFCADFCDVREICPYGGTNAVFTSDTQGMFDDLPDWSEVL